MNTRKNKKKKRRRDLSPVVAFEPAPPEIELDPITGAMVTGHKSTSHVVWARKNKPNPEQCFHFYAALPDAERIRAYVLSTDLKYSDFFVRASLAYLDHIASKGK
mgnify:CR=1 FL=1